MMAFKNDGQGAYVILHYELKGGRAGNDLLEFIKIHQGKMRSRYVYTFHGTGGRPDAILLWNALSAASRMPKGNPGAVEIRAGDIFYIHYAVASHKEIGWFREEVANNWLDPV
jgi:hypothetical protein